MNKGFTLIELMAVIILLGVLSLIATLTVSNMLSENKTEACEMQLLNIKAGAENWANKNVFNLPDEDGKYTEITLKYLQDAGFVDKNITNPKTGELFSQDIIIRITRKDNAYTYEIGAGC